MPRQPRRSTRSEGDPPANIEAEQALLGAILVNNAAYRRVSSFLLPAHFAEPIHRRIYAAVTTLVGGGQIADTKTLSNLLDQDGALAEIGGAKYLERLAASMITIINAADYGRTIYDLWQRREMIKALSPQERATMVKRLDDIEAALNKIAPLVERLEDEGTGYGEIGHNQPRDALPVGSADIEMAISASSVIRHELSREHPHGETLRLCGLALKRVWKGIGALLRWTAGKGDAFGDAFVRSSGNVVATAFGAVALTVLLKDVGVDVSEVVSTLERWVGLLR